MKNSKKKLDLNKLIISKLNNPKAIEGGDTILPTTILRSRFPDLCIPTGITDAQTLCHSCGGC